MHSRERHLEDLRTLLGHAKNYFFDEFGRAVTKISRCASDYSKDRGNSARGVLLLNFDLIILGFTVDFSQISI